MSSSCRTWPISHLNGDEPGIPCLRDDGVVGVWRKFVGSFVRHAGDAAAQKLNKQKCVRPSRSSRHTEVQPWAKVSGFERTKHKTQYQRPNGLVQCEMERCLLCFSITKPELPSWPHRGHEFPWMQLEFTEASGHLCTLHYGEILPALPTIASSSGNFN